MNRSTYRGHIIEQRPKGWVYLDNGKLVSTDPNRRCGACDRPITKDGHDGCIGELPGVVNACCGHGSVKEAYVVLRYGPRRIEGAEALAWMLSHRIAP